MCQKRLSIPPIRLQSSLIRARSKESRASSMHTMVYSVSPFPKPNLRGDTHGFSGLVFGGALFAFCVSRLPMLDVPGFYSKAGGAGEYSYMRMSSVVNRPTVVKPFDRPFDRPRPDRAFKRFTYSQTDRPKVVAV